LLAFCADRAMQKGWSLEFGLARLSRSLSFIHIALPISVTPFVARPTLVALRVAPASRVANRQRSPRQSAPTLRGSRRRRAIIMFGMNKLPIAARAKIFSMLSKGVSMRSDIARRRLSRPAPLTNGSNVGNGYLRRVILTSSTSTVSSPELLIGGAIESASEEARCTRGKRER